MALLPDLVQYCILYQISHCLLAGQSPVACKGSRRVDLSRLRLAVVFKAGVLQDAKAARSLDRALLGAVSLLRPLYLKAHFFHEKPRPLTLEETGHA